MQCWQYEFKAHSCCQTRKLLFTLITKMLHNNAFMFWFQVSFQMILLWTFVVILITSKLYDTFMFCFQVKKINLAVVIHSIYFFAFMSIRKYNLDNIISLTDLGPHQSCVVGQGSDSVGHCDWCMKHNTATHSEACHTLTMHRIKYVQHKLWSSIA